MSFSQFLQIPELRERYRKVKKHFYLRESTYDASSVCQLRCDGCYYFQGDKYKVKDVKDPEVWRRFFTKEKERGINFAVIAGAEPAIVPDVLKACYDVIPLGVVASNGLKRIDSDVGYRLHISVWGGSTGDPIYRRYYGGRPGPFCLPIQLKNYQNDERVVFVYTFNSDNADQLDEVLKMVREEGHKMTFSVFSTPLDDSSSLRFSEETLKKIREKMLEVMETYRDTVIYSYYNVLVHTHGKSLHEQFGCPYPRAQAATGNKGLGISQTFRSYRADLTYDSELSCCLPDMDCADCRHYASGTVIVTSRLNLHTGSESQFRGWLDYVDTYLATWVQGYRKDENLFSYSDLSSALAEQDRLTIA